MKYVALIYEDASERDGVPEDVVREVYEEYFALSKEAAVEGGAELQDPETATTVRIRNGETLTTDGPFAETKEQLGGYYLVDCASLDEAIEFAARIPGARHGAVEVRPLVER